jgi:DNA repair protein RadD
MILRDYQERSITEVGLEIAAGRRRPLLVAPTGSGKTIIATEVVKRALAKNRRVMFIAHRDELISQCSAKLIDHGIQHGIVSAAHGGYRPDRPVQVCSIQTLQARDEWPDADLIIIDEAHLARAARYEPLFEKYPRAVVVGLTATPIRLDGKSLGDVFDGLVVVASPRQLIDEGHLVDYEGFSYDVPDLSGVERVRGDYNASQLHQRGTVLYGNILTQWAAHARHLRTVLFAINIAHSKELTDVFRGAGIAAEHVDGVMSKKQRRALIARVRSGKTQVVTNVAILGEGFDCPELKCVVLARPTMSLALYLQQVGRGMRPEESGLLARIHDHAGNVSRHGFPDDEREWTLEDQPKKRRRDTDDAPPTRTCDKCRKIYRPSLGACPACGHVNEKSSREIEVEESAQPIELSQIRERPPAFDIPWKERMSVYMEFAEEGQRRGYKPKWAAFKYHERYRVWPPGIWAIGVSNTSEDSASHREPSSGVG